MRQRALALCAMALAALLAGCGGTVAPRAAVDTAARLVPSDALAYVHVSLGGSPGALTRLRGYAGAQSAVTDRISAITGASFATQIKPWLGDQAALAVVPDGDTAAELIVLAVRDRSAARTFLRAQHAPAARMIGSFLVLGTPAAVSGAAAVAAHRRPALSGLGAFRSLSGAEPATRVLTAYLNGRGVSGLLSGRLAALAPGARAVGAAVAPTAGGGRVWARILEPVNSRSPAPPTPSVPALPDALPAATRLVIDTPDLARAAPRLMALLPQSGVVKGIGAVLAELGQAEPGLGSLFDGEGGIFVLDGGLGVIAHSADPSQARRALANAVPVLTRLFAPAGTTGIEPELATQSVNGVAVTTLTLGASLTVSYAIDHGDIVIATGTRAVEAVVASRTPLSGSDPYQSVLGNGMTSPGTVIFTALNRIDRLPSLTGLLAAAGLSKLVPTFDQITALGLRYSGGRSQTTAELYFTIP